MVENKYLRIISFFCIVLVFSELISIQDVISRKRTWLYILLSPFNTGGEILKKKKKMIGLALIKTRWGLLFIGDTSGLTKHG